jgi:hypothetical protein
MDMRVLGPRHRFGAAPSSPSCAIDSRMDESA